MAEDTYVRRAVEAQILVHSTNRVNLLLAQIKAAAVKILSQTSRVIALGDDSHTTLGGPSEQDLRGSLGMLVRNALDRLVLEEQRGIVCLLHVQLQE